MAVQLRRIFGIGHLQGSALFGPSRLPPGMLHCRSFQSLTRSRLRLVKSIQQKTSKNMGSIFARMDAGFLSIHPNLSIRFMNITRISQEHAPGMNSCRFFSSKITAKSQARVSPKVGRPHREVPLIRSSLVQLFQERQKQSKKLSSRHGVAATTKAAETTEVVVDAPAVKKRATRAKKSISEKSETQNSEEPASQLKKKKQKETKSSDEVGKVKSTVEKVKKVSRKKLQKTPAEVDSEVKKTVKRKTKESGDSTPKGVREVKNGGNFQMGKREMKPLYPPTGKSVVVVESATKAKVIQNYIGDMFEVIPSYGHVRDLAGRSGSVRPDDDFSMVWEVPSAAWTHLKSIKVALDGVDNLILASDPDREGEAIAWHIIEMLAQQDALGENINVSRVVFHEITETSIKNALKSPRDIDANLVNAYLARRALDYLIGFSISPLLWRKLPGCQSAGRVQSAALALICDREMEIDQFKPQEYWSVEVEFGTSGSSIFSQLTHFDAKRLDQLSISSNNEADAIKEAIHSSKFTVVASKTSKIQKNPPMPYITSSLQQDAANKLQFPAAYTMKLAQKLYEGVKLSDSEATGLITYMRTDGLHISDEAAKDINCLVKERYGETYAAKSTRRYFKKVKNAQEAHEAIRPTSIRRLPSSLVGIIDEDSLKLYTLIWRRTMACQMEASTNELIQVDIGNAIRDTLLRSSASKVAFLGYQAVYQDSELGFNGGDGNQDPEREESCKGLAALKVDDPVEILKVELQEHHTKPPARYSEGSLVKKLEELGIGRPSTYAPIIKVLQDRNYVMMKNRSLIPEFRGRMVSAFLSHHFSEVADYSFTADMENELDNVSAGTTDWKGLLKDYWSRFSKFCQLASNVNIRQVEKMLEDTLGHILFASLPDKSRTCPSCSDGMLVLKVSRFGAGYFIGCNQHPRCRFIAGSVFSEDDEAVPSEKPEMCFQPKLLGLSPSSNEKIFLKNGPYGFYVQLGEDRKGCPPKRASIEAKDVDTITMDNAMELLQYPLTLGEHPDDKQPVVLKHSKLGFSIRHRRTIAPVPKNVNPKKITLEVALKLLRSKNAKQCGRPKNKPKVKETEDMLW
ncbi:DNA topoisomerase, type IA, core [Wolffia australiana]